MEGWQRDRVIRSKVQDISCYRLETTQDGCFIFFVTGATGEPYVVEIYEDVDLWDSCSCSCDDRTYRPMLCKHMCYCFRMMGMDDSVLEELFYEPEQFELYELLANAPDVVGDG